MGLEQWLEDVGDSPRPESFEHLKSEVGVEIVQEALARSGKQTIRRRLLPNEVVVWLIVGMAIFRDRAIEAVVKHLGLVPKGRPANKRSSTGSPVGSDTVAKARQRVGAGPLETLFYLLADRWLAEVADSWLWRGLSLQALDGSTLRIADTPENEAVYGRPSSNRSKAAYPQARVLSLLAVGSRLVVDFVVGTLAQSEQELADLLWLKLRDNSLTILDRGFVNYANFWRIPRSGANRHWLCRGKSNMAFRVVKILGPGDLIVELKMSAKQRKSDPTLPTKVLVRMLEYHLAGSRTKYRLLTSLVDHEAYPADEVIRLYHDRWEVEIAFAEKKVQMLERRETIRSKTPEGVWQEVWGIVIAYNIVRIMMARAAVQAKVAPCRLSFRNSLLQIRSFLLAAPQVSPGTLPRLYKDLCEDLTHLLLPERRNRSYPRAVKIKMSSYKKKCI